MKTERRIKKGKNNGLTATISVAAMLTVVALFAFAAAKDAMAGTVTVPAPKETASIHLGVKDPPATVKLKGWYCSKTKKMKHDVGVLRWRVFSALGRDDYNASAAFVAKLWALDFLGRDWPFKLAGLQKSPTKTGLDAPPGGSKIYTFKYCYTANELKMIRDKVYQWIYVVMGMEKLIVGEGPDYAIGFFGGQVNPGPQPIE